MSKRNSAVAAAAAAVSAVTLAGCDEYFDRRDTITYGVGDSVSVNKTTQTIERWPNAARYDRWASDGERARLAIEKYRKREVKIEKPDPGVLGSSTTGGGP